MNNVLHTERRAASFVTSISFPAAPCSQSFGATTPRVNKPQKEGVMSGTITAKKLVTHPYFSMICALCILFVLPRYGGIAVMVGCASVLTALVAVLPEIFRDRTGSMMTATCLVATMWVAAAVITTLTLMGEIQS